MFSASYDIKERFYHVENKIMPIDDLALNREQYYAKMILNQIENQNRFKKSFQNSVIIRYEDLVSEPSRIIEMLEQRFEIKADTSTIKEILGRPSYSSKSTRHDITEIKDEFAKSMIKKASELWEYQYDAKLKEDYSNLINSPSLYFKKYPNALLQWIIELQNEIKILVAKASAHYEQLMKEKDTHIASMQSAIKEKDTHIASMQSAIKEKDTHIASMQSAIEAIEKSFTWKLLRRYDKVRGKANEPKNEQK